MDPMGMVVSIVPLIGGIGSIYSPFIGKDYKWYISISGIFSCPNGWKYHRSHLLGERETTIDDVPLNVDECFTQKVTKRRWPKAWQLSGRKLRAKVTNPLRTSASVGTKEKKYNMYTYIIYRFLVGVFFLFSHFFGNIHNCYAKV